MSYRSWLQHQSFLLLLGFQWLPWLSVCQGNCHIIFPIKTPLLACELLFSCRYLKCSFMLKFRLKELYQSTVDIPTPGFTTTVKKEPRKPILRKKTYWIHFLCLYKTGNFCSKSNFLFQFWTRANLGERISVFYNSN